MRRDPTYHLNYRYAQRMMGCLAVALLLMIAVFKGWPADSPEGETPSTVRVHQQETIEISEVQQTQQGFSTPPPPAPIPPVAVPDELVLEDKPLDLDLSLLPLADAPADGRPGQPDGSDSRSTGAVYYDPRLVGFAEPEYTREMRRNRVRAEFEVRVLVDEKGAVRQAEIVERFLLIGETNAKRRVDQIGFGAEEAVLAAIERCKFQPARRNGEPVEGYTTVTMSIAG